MSRALPLAYVLSRTNVRRAQARSEKQAVPYSPATVIYRETGETESKLCASAAAKVHMEDERRKAEMKPLVSETLDGSFSAASKPNSKIKY